MATTVTIAATAYSVQTAKTTQVYGQVAKLPVTSGKADALVRAPLTTKIPKNAVISSAVVSVWTNGAHTGTLALSLGRALGAWTSSVTWKTKPAEDSTLVTVSKASPAGGTRYDFDVTSLAQQIVSGALADYGWFLTSAATAVGYVYGSSASAHHPQLVVTYTVPPAVPSNLHPSGSAIAVSNPVLTWDAPEDVTSIEVQIDPAMNGDAPAWDSGTVAATGGLLDLAATTYPGVADQTTTYWRAQQANGAGWSGWSPWYALPRVAHYPLTITSPPPTSDGSPTQVDDGTFPLVWSFGGTQTAWQARLIDQTSGDVLADSGRVSGAADEWTPPKGLTTRGQLGTVELTAWDDQDRAVTPGSPDNVTAELVVQLSEDGTIAPVDTLTATNDGMRPTVLLTGSRAEGVPDAYAVLRNGVEVARFTGTDASSGTDFIVDDPFAVMQVAATYNVVPVVNGKRGPVGPSVTITPRCQGIWLGPYGNPNQRVVVWSTDDQDQQIPELEVVHQPIAGTGAGVSVRRRLVRFLPQGTVTGTLIDSGIPGAPSAIDCEAMLDQWAAADAGDLYSLVLGRKTYKVVIGDVAVTETAIGDHERIASVTFNWWAQP